MYFYLKKLAKITERWMTLPSDPQLRRHFSDQRPDREFCNRYLYCEAPKRSCPRSHITFLTKNRRPLIARGKQSRSSISKGLSIKDVRSQGERGLSSADMEVLQIRTSVLFGVKTSDFSKFMVCLHRQGGRKVNLLRFCADVLYGRPLKAGCIAFQCRL